MSRDEEKNFSGENSEENSIEQQSQEAWKKYGDNAREKGFTFKREGEGLPDEQKGDSDTDFVSAPTKGNTERREGNTDRYQGSDSDTGFVSAPTKNNSERQQGSQSDTGFVSAPTKGHSERHQDLKGQGQKENSLHETVTLDTNPYDGPSKLAAQPDMDDSGQSRSRNNSTSEDYLGSHSSAYRAPDAAQRNNRMVDKDTIIKVDALQVEAPMNTENRTYTAEASHNLNPKGEPMLDSDLTMDAAERDKAIGKDFGPERNNNY